MAKHEIIHLNKKGVDVLNRSLLNKGTAFTEEERNVLKLHGLLPTKVSSVEEQIQRTYLNCNQKRTPLEKYELLMTILRRNELLFYQFVLRYAHEFLPIIYTPTVGDAAMQYSRIYFHQRGLYIPFTLKDRMDEIFDNYTIDDVEVIVVTDGERILGLGDQGVGGMTIPIGKLALYTLFGGIHPARTLPIILDVGTNNPELVKDDLYLGSNHKRIEGEEYHDFIDTFVESVKKRYPKAILQWEDFGKNNARKILDRHRNNILSFNDDIQGTAAVALGAIYAGAGVNHEKLTDQRIVIFGAGSAGTGIADVIALALHSEGLSLEEARRRIYLIDTEGLIHFGSRIIHESQKPYMQPQSVIKDWNICSSLISLHEVVANAHPTVLIGVSACSGGFSKDVIEEMSKHVKHPIILPLSNPTSKVECTPEEALFWSKGQAIVASGSPFADVEYEDKTYKIAQCNNVYVFPAVGLGALAVKASMVTDGMFLEAAKALATFSPALKDPTAALFPEFEEVREISKKIAKIVANKAIEDGVSKESLEDVDALIEAHIWEPHYPRYAVIMNYD